VAVGYDSVGPSSAGTAVGSVGVLSWSHTTVASSTLIVAGYTLDTTNSAGTSSATLDSVAMSSFPAVLTSGGSGGSYLQVFYGIASGTSHTVAITGTGTADAEVAGSIAFTGAVTLGTPVTSSADSTYSVAVAANTSGNMIVGFMASGSNITATTAPATSQFVDNYKGSGGGYTGNIAGATSPATGSSVTMGWTSSAGSMCILAVEVQAPTGTNTSPAWGVSQDVVSGGTGSWTNPANVLTGGGSGGPWATWTAP
jgi:hypothetical protein